MKRKISLILTVAIMSIRILISAPAVDNNAGTWTDGYSDGLGISSSTNVTVDGSAGVVKLVSGATSGNYTTVDVIPTSFRAWKEITLSGDYASASDILVDVLDGSGNVIAGYSNLSILTPIDISGISADTYDKLKVRVKLNKSGAVAPSVDELKVSWDPLSYILLDKSAPDTEPAGDIISYHIRYSVNFVKASELVIWDKLPNQGDGSVVLPTDYGQDDSSTFVSASSGGQYTPTAITVKGIDIPANSVYWDLGDVDEGFTDLLDYSVRSPNGTLDHTVYSNRVFAAASNADTNYTDYVPTVITSTPHPVIDKREGVGIISLPSGLATRAGATNSFSISARNNNSGVGGETMYNTVVYDDVSDLLNVIDTSVGSNGFFNISGGGVYNSSYTPPSGGAAIPAIVWNVGTLSPGASASVGFSVLLLNSPPQSNYVNDAYIDSDQTTVVHDSLEITIGIDETPGGSFAKGDGPAGYITSIGGGNDQANSYIRYGDTYPYALKVINDSAVKLNDLVFLDQVPPRTIFNSAWVENTNINATIYYTTTTNYPDRENPPPVVYTNAPAGLGPDWTVYDPDNPPADSIRTNISWVAYYIPQVSSIHFPPADPVSSAIVYFDVKMKDAIMPCQSETVENLGIFRVYEYTDLSGTKQAVSGTLESTDIETTVAKPLVGEINIVSANITPEIVDVPDNSHYTLTFKNSSERTSDTLTNVTVTLNWSKISVNGVMIYPSFVGAGGGSVVSFNPTNGTLTLSIGTMPPGVSHTVTLDLSLPTGSDNGSEYSITADITGEDDYCSVPVTRCVTKGEVRSKPQLNVVKNDVVDLIGSGDIINYTMTYYNTGNGPSHNTWVIDHVPEKAVFVSATGQDGARVYVSDTPEPDMPSSLTVFDIIDSARIAQYFTPATLNDGGTPNDPSDDVWTSPYGEQTLWVAWVVDDESFSPSLVPSQGSGTIGLKVRNDDDGTGSGTNGSAYGTLIFNEAGILSDELITAIGNEVITTISQSPGIQVSKSGPSVRSAGDTFEWTVEYVNSSANDDTEAEVTDRLPVGVTFVSATHTWNSEAVNNGASAVPAQDIPSGIVTNSDGTVDLKFSIAPQYRGSALRSLEGGTIKITVQVDSADPSGMLLNNHVCGIASNAFSNVQSCDDHTVQVSNPDLWLRKLVTPQEVSSGGEVTYTLLLANMGKCSASGVEITDTLPAGMSYVAGSTTILTANWTLGEPTVSGQTLTWSDLTGGTNAVGLVGANSGDIMIQYKATVGSGVASGTSLTNAAATTTTSTEDNVYTNNATAVVRIPHPDPAVSKTGPEMMQPGGRVSWSIVYHNTKIQDATGVYLIDTLPDSDTNGTADVTFVSSQEDGPNGSSPAVWYHSGSSSTVPAFDPANPAAGGWTNDASSITVNHIAWNVGTLPALSGPFNILVQADLLDPVTSQKLPAGMAMTNRVEIFSSSMDDNPSNNVATAGLRTPGLDMALEKSGSVEGAFPGIAAGKSLTYTLNVRNSGSQTAWGIKVVDTLPTYFNLGTPADNFAVLSLTDADGNPVNPVDQTGSTEITDDVPITRVVSGSTVTWYFGKGPGNESDSLYYRKIGIPAGARVSFDVYGSVDSSAADGTVLENSATVISDRRNDTEPVEEYLDNNTDDSDVTVRLPDLTVRKSVKDVMNDSETETETGHILEYTLKYKNIGSMDAENSSIEEIVPDGTTLLNVNNPLGSSVSYNPAQSNATSFSVNLGTLRAPSDFVGIPTNHCFANFASKAVEITNGKNGMNSGALSYADMFGYSVAPAGDINGDGVQDIIVGARGNDDGGSDAGAVWVLLMNTNGTAKTAVELASGKNGMSSAVTNYDYFGYSVASAGDIDGDGVPDIIAGAPYNDDGGSYAGAVWVLLMNTNGTAKSSLELADGMNGMSSDVNGGDRLGYSVVSGGDIDGDGVPDIIAGAYGNSGGMVWVLFMNTNGTVKNSVKLADGMNGMSSDLMNGDELGCSVASAGDIDGDGIPDIIAGAKGNDDGGSYAGAVWVILLNTNGTAKSSVELASGMNGMSSDLNSGDQFGYSVASSGDIDGDGVPDIVAGAPYNDDGANNAGGAWVILLNTNGTAKSYVELASGMNGMSTVLLTNDKFGNSVVSGGDIDGNGVPDIVVGDMYSDYGAADGGAVWVLLMNSDGTIKGTVGLATGINGSSTDIAASDYFGCSVASIGDLDGDGHPDIVAGAYGNDDGNSSVGAVWVIPVDLSDGASCSNSSGTTYLEGEHVTAGELMKEVVPGQAKDAVEIGNGQNGMSSGLNSYDYMGYSVSSAGDIDGDGVPDIIAGAKGNDDGGSDAGAVWVLLMNTNRTVKNCIKLASGMNGMSSAVTNGDYFGYSVASAGDIDGDGVPDIIAGAKGNDDGGSDAGAAWVLLMNSDGTVKSAVELASGMNGMSSALASGDSFGHSVVSVGDVDGDGVPDIIAGASGNDDGGSSAGAVWVLLMNTDGTVKSAVELADGMNGMSSDLSYGDYLGYSVASAGDIDGDGVPDIISGAYGNDDGGVNCGAVWVILLNTDGTAKGAVELAYGLNGMSSDLVAYDQFGESVASAGDIDGDGVPDVIAGAQYNDDGGDKAGAVWVLLMNTNGTVKTAVELADGMNGMSAALEPDDRFGTSVTSVGDVDGDGVPDIVAGAWGNDDGANRAGAVWVLMMNTNGTVHSSVELADGINGMSNGLAGNNYFGYSVASLGDIDGNGLVDIIGSAYGNDSFAGGLWIIELADRTEYYTNGVYESVLSAASVDSWDHLYSESEIPTGTRVVYKILDTSSNEVMSEEGPLSGEGMDISGLDPAVTYTLRVELMTTDRSVTPTFKNWVATYHSTDWPSFTFRVRVDDPVPNAVLPDINNHVNILTSTPESDYTNNSDDDTILVNITDLEVQKSVDHAASSIGSNLLYTLIWANNGPQAAVNAVLTDNLPYGVEPDTNNIVPAYDSISGDGSTNNPYVITWNLGDAVSGTNGTVTIPVTISTNMTGETLINAAHIGNDRQESDYDNNDDTVVTYVGNVANVFITKKCAVSSAEPGDNVAWSLTYGNNGNIAALNSKVTDELPSGLTYVSSVPAASSVSGQTVAWNLGTLGVGVTGVITLVSSVDTNWDLVGTNLVNPATITTVTSETTLSDNSDNDQVYITVSPARLSGNVWLDDNRDVNYDVTENGISGVKVVLIGTDVFGNSVTLTNTTDASGHYSFSGINPGTYTVTETQPDGYGSSGATNGTINGVSAGSISGVNQISSVTLGSGEASVNNDFGDTLGELGDHVWLDIDNDGIQDAGETNVINGVIVRLYDAASNLVATTVTTGSGDYLFTGLTGGTYYVDFDTSSLGDAFEFTKRGSGNNGLVDSDVNPVTGRTPAITLADGEDKSDVDAGIVYPPSPLLGNYIWLDEDRDGIQDAGEPGIANVMVIASNRVSGEVYTNWTDVDGHYLFDDLSAGSYSVIVPAANFSSGASLVGMEQTVTARAGEDFGNQTNYYAVTLAADGRNRTADFGYNFNPTDDPDEGAIGDRLWIDADGDGVQDAEEIGLGGVTVKLLMDLDGDGVYETVASNVVTDVNGNYIFDGLSAGGYVVEVDSSTLSAGYTQTGDPDEFGQAASSPDNKTTMPIILAPGDVFINADFGYQPAGGSAHKIGDRIWLDADADGVQDAGEPGINGVTVSLISDTDGDGVWEPLGADGIAGTSDDEPVIGTDITDGNGTYLFEGLPDDDYIVLVDDNSGVLNRLEESGDPDATKDDMSAVTLSGADNLSQDFGYTDKGHETGKGIIGDTVFLDLDGDGQPDTGEGIEGVVVTLLDTNGNVVAVTETGPNGLYLFGGLDDGDYIVRIDSSTLPDGVSNTVDPDGGTANESNVTISGHNTDLDQDFGYEPLNPNTIGGTIWEDRNADGTYASGTETNMFEGVTVSLLDADGTVIVTTVTDSDGNYSFTGLPDGTYTVDVTDNDNVLGGYWHSDGPNDGSDNNSQDDPYTVSVSGGQTDTTGDFGYFIDGAALGNWVWHDNDDNSIQSAGDTGISNVLLTLEISYGAVTTTVVTVTDTSGYYSFGNLMLDEDDTNITYKLSVTTPSGLYPVRANASADSTIDSNNSSNTVPVVERGVTDVGNDSAADTTADAPATYDFGYDDHPTLVVVSGFSAATVNGEVVVAWDIELEVGTIGYYLERKTESGWVRINDQLISRLPFNNAEPPYHYSVVDNGVQSGETHTWRIVELDNQGRLLIYGPYTVTVDGTAISYETWAAGIDWNGANSSRDGNADGDGFTNFEEYLAGTDPLDKNSLLKISGMEISDSGDIVVKWQSASGIVYSVEISTDINGNWLPITNGIQATPPNNVNTITVDSASAPQMFFRVIAK